MKILFTIIIVLAALKSYSQSKPQSYYQTLFDDKGYDKSIRYSTDENRLEFSWGLPAQMEALVLMYEKTGEKKYAETLVKCIGNVIDRRDDLRGQLQGLRKVSDYRGVSGAVWSTNHYNEIADSGSPYAHLVHSANLLYPMAKFVAIVKTKGSGVQNLISDPQGRYGKQTYKRIADDIIQKINETLDFHEDQWQTESVGIGYYRERDNNPPIKYAGKILPFNMQSSIGRVFVQMYRATSKDRYLTKLIGLSNFLKSNTFFNKNLQSNIWKYWGNTDLYEDIPHAGLTISFPYECYKYNILYKGKPIYSLSDIQYYINTFMKDIYQFPLSVNMGVNYNKESWNIKSNNKIGDSPYGNYINYMWLYLSEYDKRLYQIIADLLAAKNYYEKIEVEGSFLTVALLANFENLIVPVNTDHSWNKTSDWQGVASGNFDDDSEDEFVIVRNSDGMIGVREPYNKEFRSVANNKYYNGQYNWKGIAAGDFFDDNKSEIIALSYHADPRYNGLYVLKVENKDIIEKVKFTGLSTKADWVGVVAGNFISGGKDECVVVGNANKEVLVYKFNGTDVQIVHTNALNLPKNSKITAVAAGNLNNDLKDEIVLAIDSPDTVHNGIYVYNIDDKGIVTKIAQSVGSARVEWKGLAVGDINGDGINEVIAHKNSDGEYLVYKLTKNGLSTLGSERFPILQTKNNIMCLGNFNTQFKNDELITLRNDGGVVLFSAAKIIRNTNNSTGLQQK